MPQTSRTSLQDDTPTLSKISKPFPLLALPNEILTQIYEYFDWHPPIQELATSNSFREDLLDSRLVCKLIKEVTTPLVFRTVTIKVYWNSGRIAMPGVHKLRRLPLPLAKHIRHLRIDGILWWDSRYSTSAHCEVFESPTSADLWDVIAADTQRACSTVFGDRVSDLLAEILSDCSASKPELAYPTQGPSSPVAQLREILREDSSFCQAIAEDGLEHDRPFLGCDGLLSENDMSGFGPDRHDGVLQQRHTRLRLHALAYVLLCLPPRPLLTLTVKIRKYKHDLGIHFLKAVVGTILQLHGVDSLQHLEIDEERFVSLASYSWPWASTRFQWDALCQHIGRLSMLTSLTIPLVDRSIRHGMISVERSTLQPLIQLSSSIRHLTFRRASVAASDLMWFVSSFPRLETLLCWHVTLVDDRTVLDGETEWLKWLTEPRLIPWIIVLRRIQRTLPSLHIQLEHVPVEGRETRDICIPPAGIAWLVSKTDPMIVGQSGEESAEQRIERMKLEFEQAISSWEEEAAARHVLLSKGS